MKDGLSGIEYQIISKYLFGADGGHSAVVEQAGLPMKVFPCGGNSYNVVLRCDLQHLVKGREGNLHWNLRLKQDDPWMINMRMVKPWFEWMMVCLPKDPFQSPKEKTADEWKEVLRGLIDDPNADVEIMSLSKWQINEAFVSDTREH